MDPLVNILEERKKTSDFLWACRKWNPTCSFAQIKVSNPNDIKSKAVSSHQILETVQELSALYNIPQDDLFERASDYVKEMAYDKSITVVKILAFFTSKFLKNQCPEINVNESKFLKIKSQIGRNPVLLVPNHRSYSDFITMSYLCFNYEIDIPRVAAGMDFHSMSYVGEILRKCCAFFMRRSFTDNALYSVVFGQYLQTLLVNGEASVEFFIEGTRSRTGKSLVPKYGFLSMTLKPFLTALVPDITFVPISFNYDRVMEERLFAFELLGIPKPKESTRGLLKVLKNLRENFGSIYIDFGDPISVKEFLGDKIDRSVHNFGPVELQQLTPYENNEIVRLAHTIVHQQQRLCIITCFNLIATVINHHVTKSYLKLNLCDLVSEVQWLYSVMKELGARISISGNLPDSVLQNIKLHKSLVSINSEKKIQLLRTNVDESDKSKMKGHSLLNNTMGIAIPLLMIQYYSNPCAYFLVNLCFISLIVQSEKNEKLTTDGLFKRFQFLRSVFSKEFVLVKDTEEQDFAAAFEYGKKQKVIIQSGSEVKKGENEKLRQFCSSFVRLYICSYLVFIDILLKEPDGFGVEENFGRSYQKAVELLVMEEIQIHPASLSLDLVKNALKAFVEMGAIKKYRRGNELFYEIINDKLENIKKRLGTFDVGNNMNGRISIHLTTHLSGKL